MLHAAVPHLSGAVGDPGGVYGDLPSTMEELQNRWRNPLLRYPHAPPGKQCLQVLLCIQHFRNGTAVVVPDCGCTNAVVVVVGVVVAVVVVVVLVVVAVVLFCRWWWWWWLLVLFLLKLEIGVVGAIVINQAGRGITYPGLNRRLSVWGEYDGTHTSSHLYRA